MKLATQMLVSMLADLVGADLVGAVPCAVVILALVEEEVSSRGEGPLRGLPDQVFSDSTQHPDRSSDRSRYHTRVSSRHHFVPADMCRPVPTECHRGALVPPLGSESALTAVGAVQGCHQVTAG